MKSGKTRGPPELSWISGVKWRSERRHRAPLRAAAFGISCAYVVFSGELRVNQVMTTFPRRLVGAATLESRIYEEVEADRQASAQAVAVVLLASIAGGIGLLGAGVPTLASLIAGVVGSLLGWISWAALTFVIGTRLLPEPQTKADVGELLRTIAFASAPGLLRALGVVPVAGQSIYVLASIWMLVAMIVAVRQALDYKSTARAVGVCLVGWALSLVVAAIIGVTFTRTVS